MSKKILLSVLSASLAVLPFAPFSFGQTTTTTTVETVQPAKKGKKSREPAVTTTTTTVVTPPPPKEIVYKVYDEETLKKIAKTLCTDGFKSYVGTDKKNVCKGKATAPDFAFSCVWNKKGPAAFAPTAQGPCNLDYAVHQGSIKIQKDNFPSDPPLDYGLEAQCCFRPAKGYEAPPPASAPPATPTTTPPPK